MEDPAGRVDIPGMTFLLRYVVAYLAKPNLTHACRDLENQVFTQQKLPFWIIDPKDSQAWYDSNSQYQPALDPQARKFMAATTCLCMVFETSAQFWAPVVFLPLPTVRGVAIVIINTSERATPLLDIEKPVEALCQQIYPGWTMHPHYPPVSCMRPRSGPFDRPFLQKTIKLKSSESYASGWYTQFYLKRILHAFRLPRSAYNRFLHFLSVSNSLTKRPLH